MTPLTQQLEDKKKELKQDKALGIGNRIYRLQAEIAILEQAIAEMQKQRQEISKSLRERIMRNGNLSNRIIENNYGEFEHKHDYILNKIVCEIIEEELQQLNQPKEDNERRKIKLATMPYGLCREERGWKYTESTQPTPNFLRVGAVGVSWKSRRKRRRRGKR
jgi:uncharacterized protein YllA (UPF0747 family)